MAQKTFIDEVLTASDVNTYLAGEGGQWSAWTPVIDQGASTNIAKTVTYSRYARYGRTIIWNFSLALTAAGTAGSAVTVSLPVTAAVTAGVRGSVLVFDASEQNNYPCIAASGNTTTTTFVTTTVGVNASWGASPNIALASGDVLSGSITYEAAS